MEFGEVHPHRVFERHGERAGVDAELRRQLRPNTRRPLARVQGDRHPVHCLGKTPSSQQAAHAGSASVLIPLPGSARAPYVARHPGRMKHSDKEHPDADKHGDGPRFWSAQLRPSIFDAQEHDVQSGRRHAHEEADKNGSR
jgi:hypothetical protein